jgi:hypothetical protein
MEVPQKNSTVTMEFPQKNTTLMMEFLQTKINLNEVFSTKNQL